MGNLIILLFIFFIVIPKMQQKKAQREKMMRDNEAARRAEAAVRAAQNAAQSAAAAQRAAELNAAAARNAQQNAAAARRAQDAGAYPPPTRAPKYQQASSGVPQKNVWEQLRSLKDEQSESALSMKKMLGLAGGILGGAIAGLFGLVSILSLTEFVDSLIYGFFFMDELTASIILALFAAGGGLLAKKSLSMRKRIKRFELYRTIIGDKRECPITDIARASGRKPQEVLRELQDMVRHGYFPLGFADAETGCFYADNEAYRQHNPEKAKWEDAALLGQSGPQPAAQPAPQPAPQPEPAQNGTLSDAQLREYKRLMERVQDTAIREKAVRLYEHAEDIFAWVQLHPECTDDVRRFCSYYLPTANKLLATYNEIAPHKNDSRVAANIESEVSRVLDTMTTAFRGLMDNLLQNTVVDMQAEISALETVLAQEGLTQNGLTL